MMNRDRACTPQIAVTWTSTGFCRRWVLLAALACLYGTNVPNAKGQTYLQSTGSPTFSTQLPVENGYIDASNGRLHLEIPMGSYPQRARRQYDVALMYDSAIWTHAGTTTWQPTNVLLSTGLGGGWREASSGYGGSVSYTSWESGWCSSDGPGFHRFMNYGNFTYTEPNGTVHSFPVHTYYNESFSCPGLNSPNSSGWASDASGFWMTVTQYTYAGVVAPDGTGGMGYQTDSNGNYNGYPAPSYLPTDTLGRALDTTAVNGNTVTYTLPNAQGGTSVYTITTATINAKTNFGQSGVTECTTGSCTTLTVVRSVQLPDSTEYTFKYDCDKTVDSTDCSSPTGQSGYYGLLTSMTLPTGGQITYAWSPYIDSQGNHYEWISNRATTDGSTAYTPHVVSTCGSGQVNCQQTFTVQKPSGDNTVYTFTLNGGAWTSEADYYTGSVSSSNLVGTTTQCWNFVTITNGACSYTVTTGSPSTGIQKMAASATLPTPAGSVSKTTQYKYDGYGNTTQIQENNYYTGTLPTAVDRTTSISYLNTTAYLNALILNRPTNITVTNSGGATVAQTLYSYDGSALIGGAVGSCPTVTGTVNHNDTNYGTGNTVRGNVTQIQRLVSGTSNYLTTTMTYDITGHLRTSMDSKGNTTSYCYADSFFDDNNSNPPASHPALSAATNAYLTTVTPANSALATTLGYYYGTGQIAEAKDANGNFSYPHFYDPLNRPTGTSSPNGGWTFFQYPTVMETDSYIGITSATASASCSSCLHRASYPDSLSRPQQSALINDPDGLTTDSYVAYDSNGRVDISYNPMRTANDPTWGYDTYGYDGLDRVLAVNHSDGSATHTYYGAAITSAVGQTAQQCVPTSTYGIGYPVLVVDEAGNKRQTWTDGFGRLIETDEPNASGSLAVATCYTYDLHNNLLQVTSLGLTQTQKPTYTYDLLSRATSKALPESGTTNFYYTTTIGGTTPCSGDPTAVCLRKDARGITTTYTYDNMNRLISKSYNDSNPQTPTVTYSYDSTSCLSLSVRCYNLGRRTGMSDGSGSTAWAYDAVGNILRESRTIKSVTETITYTYNLDGSIATITYPGGRTVLYTTSNAQRVTSAKDSVNTYINYATSATYAAPGELASVIHGYASSAGFAGITESYTYNNRLEVTAIKATSSADTPLNLSYSYPSGNNGNIATQTNNVTSGRTENYTYDPLNRLLTAQTQASSGGDCWGQEFGNNATPPTLAADALANLFYTRVTQCSAPAPQFTMNPSNNNQFTGTGIGYDSDGDMTQDTAYTYTYDAENRIITASGMTNGPYCYTYDGNGLRVMKAHASGGSCTSTVTVDMLYWRNIAGNTIAETDGTGSTTNSSYNEYILFAGRRIAQSTSGYVFYYFVDHLGSTRVVTNSNGYACYEVDYLPYGTENTPAGFSVSCSGAPAFRYRFTGYERDLETAYGNSAGNDYAFARYYNSRLGRFMSGDPLDGDITDPQTLNRYAYVRDDPINGVDPRGLCKMNTFEDTGFDFCAWEFGMIWTPYHEDRYLEIPPPPPPKPPAQVAAPAPKPHKRNINPKVLQDCIKQIFQGVTQSSIQVQNVTPSTPGGFGQISVRIQSFSGVTTVTNDASTYSSAQIASMYPPGSLGPTQFYAGTAPKENPFLNYTNNNNNALGTVRSQVHEFGHSLFEILTATVDTDPGYGGPLDDCVNKHAGYSVQ